MTTPDPMRDDDVSDETREYRRRIAEDGPEAAIAPYLVDLPVILRQK